VCVGLVVLRSALKRATHVIGRDLFDTSHYTFARRYVPLQILDHTQDNAESCSETQRDVVSAFCSNNADCKNANRTERCGDRDTS